MKTFTLLMCASVALSAGAHSKLDAAGRARVRALSAPVEMVRTNGSEKIVVKHNSRAAATEAYVRAFISSTDVNATVVSLEQLGVIVDRTRGNVVLAQFPAGLIESVEAIESITRISVESPVEQKMDLVRPAVGVDKIHAGEGLPQAYTGKGVVTGIVDGGFDPNHVNFKNEDGTSRIKMFTYFRAQSGESSELLEERYGPDYMPEIDTENAESFHATHTTGIMAGGYRGELDVAKRKNALVAYTEKCANPYYGIAYGSDIATASAYQGQLSDYYIARGIESLLDYAYVTEQPLVVNLSLGSNTGPHDGSSAICQYLDGIIADPDVNTHVCISAGNEGDMPIAITKTLTADDNTVGSGLYAIYNNQIQGYQNPRTGLVYIYSDSEQPFDIQFQIYNTGRNRVAQRYVLDGNPEGASKYWVSSSDWQQESGDVIDNLFARYFNGYIGINCELDSYSGRFYAVLDFTTFDNVSLSYNRNGAYALGFQITGQDGQRIDIYGDGGMCNFTTFGNPDYTEGGFNGTINDIACGYSPVIVGSYNTRDDYAALDGGIYGYQGAFPYGKMSAFTSFGQLVDGRTLPDVCAPGATVISSSNEYYLEAANKVGQGVPLAAALNDGTRTHSYHECIGTSMAAPVVSGCIALWLEAYPQLTAAEAKAIVKRTAIKDDDVATSGDPMQWGAGKIDAYAGLKEVLALKNAGVDNVLADDNDNRLNITATGDRTYEILMVGAPRVDAVMYTIAGQQVLTASSDSQTLSLDASALTPGVYLLRVNGTESTKLVIR